MPVPTCPALCYHGNISLDVHPPEEFFLGHARRLRGELRRSWSDVTQAGTGVESAMQDWGRTRLWTGLAYFPFPGLPATVLTRMMSIAAVAVKGDWSVTMTQLGAKPTLPS